MGLRVEHAEPVNAPSARHTAAPTSGWPRRWWSAVRTGIWIALSRVVAGVLVGHAVLLFFPQSLLNTKLGTLSTNTWLGAFDRWDARYYLAIAAHGYPAHAPDARAFFPGYPVLVRLVHDSTGGVLSFLQAGCIVSFTAFSLAAGLLYHQVAKRFGARPALVSTVLFCWFPTSVFFLAPYSESLFALEILVVVTLLDRGRWWWAAVVAGCASATSPESAALTAALVVAALVAHRGLLRAIGYGAVGSFGAAAYVTYLGLRFGKPFDFAMVLSDFHRVAVVPFVGIVQNVASLHHAFEIARSSGAHIRPIAYDVVWMQWLDDLVVVLGLCALGTLVAIALTDRRGPGVPAVTRVPVAWMVVLAGIVVTASSTVIRTPGAPDSTEGAARLVSVAFPLYPGLYLLVRRWQAPAILGLGLSAAAAILTQVLFNLGYWVT